MNVWILIPVLCLAPLARAAEPPEDDESAAEPAGNEVEG